MSFGKHEPPYPDPKKLDAILWSDPTPIMTSSISAYGTLSAIFAISFDYEILNLGNSIPVKLTDFIKAAEIQIGKAAKIEKYPFQPGDVFQTLADIEKSKKELGYEPKVSLNEGLKRMVEWYNETQPRL